MSEVGALIVRLQAETAQFREDMGKVKSDLNDLKGGADGAGSAIRTNMTDSRQSVMLLGEEIGVHMPRALSMFISKLPGVGQAMQMAFPIIGIVAVIDIIAKLIAEHEKLKDAADQVKGSQASLAGTIASTMTGLQDKLLQAGIAADDLAGNHLAAVKKQLELIDHQSLSELASTFDTLAKAAEASFAQLKAHWYEFSAGSEGAKHSLASFQAQYEMLLKTGKSDEANKLLDDKIARERTILELQKEAASTEGTGLEQMDRRANAIKQMVALTGQVVDYDDKTISSEQDLVDILQAQVQARATIAKTATIQKSTVSEKGALQSMAEEASLQKILTAGVEEHSQALIKLARTQAETTTAAGKGGQDDGTSNHLAQQKAAIEAEKDDSIAAAKAELMAKLAVYDADIKAAGANAEKKKELDAQWANDVHAYSDAVVQYNAEANKQIVAADRAAANERAAADKELAAKEASDAMSLAELTAQIGLKADEQAAKNRLALHNATHAETLQAEIAAVNAQTSVEVAGYNARLQNLDKFDKDYLAQVAALNTEITKATMKGDAEVTALTNASQQQQLMTVKQAQDKMADSIASSIAKDLVMNKSLAASFRQTGEQMAEQMIKNLLVAEMTGDKQKLTDASTAAANSYQWASAWGGPIAGGVAAAASFAAVMSFEEGGKIPGASVGSAGAVPIIGHQGETVVTKALTDRVEASERGGVGATGMSVHYSPTIHAVDSKGVDDMLTKHASLFQRHMQSAMRRMNK